MSPLAGGRRLLAAAGGDAVSTLAAAGGDAVSTLAPAINTAARNLPTVLAHEAELPRVFVHLSAFAGIRGMMSSNMIVLRALALLSSSAALAFNMWNGLRSPAFWNLAFIAVNLRRLTQLVLAEQTCVTLDADEQKLYESAFAPYGVTLRDFSTLLREASSQWREFEANEVILKEGDLMPLLYYVVDGEVEVLFNEGTRVTNVLTPGKNGWLGELGIPTRTRRWERPAPLARRLPREIATRSSSPLTARRSTTSSRARTRCAMRRAPPRSPTSGASCAAARVSRSSTPTRL